MNNVKSAIVAVSACAALAAPAVALADGGPGGPSHGPNPHANRHALEAQGRAHSTNGPDQHALRAHGRSQRLKPHGHRHDRNAIVSGTVQSVAGDVVTVNVQGGNRAGRAFAGQAVQFDLSSARVVVRDVNGDGHRDAADLAAGDHVLVQAWLPRDGSGAQPFAARRLVDRGARTAGGSNSGA